MAEEVTVYVYSGSDPVNDVYVGLHDSVTKALLQHDTTGAGALPDGTVVFSNVTPDTYEIRIVPEAPMYPLNGKVQTVEVLNAPTPPDSNIFDVALQAPGLPVATNALLCRCSGYFLDATGAARPDLSIHIKNLSPVRAAVGSTPTYKMKGVSPDTAVLVTDSAGYVVVDLFRGAYYQVMMEGLEHTLLTILVPDASAANIIDVIYPYVSHVLYYENDVLLNPITAPTTTLSVDEVKELSYEVVLRNTNAGDLAEVTFASSDETVLLVSASDGVLSLTGVAAGAANVVVSNVITDVASIVTPVPDIYADLSVTVA